jgi:hypothetical protein
MGIPDWPLQIRILIKGRAKTILFMLKYRNMLFYFRIGQGKIKPFIKKEI